MSFQPTVESLLFPLASTELSLNEPFLTFSWLGIMLLSGYVFYRIAWGNKAFYSSIPVIGSSDLLSSYRSALNFTTQGIHMLQMGYEKYKGGVFRVSELGHWSVIVSGRNNMKELAKAPDDSLSFMAALEETLFMKHLVGPTINSNPYHIELVRVNLTRNLCNLFEAVNEEIRLAFEDNIPLTHEWNASNVYPTITQIVARASSRTFVGIPLCRNPDYLDLSIKLTLNVAHSSDILRRIPDFLRGIVAQTLTSAPKTTRLTHKYLGPVIKERQKLIDEYGPEYPDKPNDFLSWLMDVAEGEERTPLRLTNRILALNFAAIHTSSLTFTHALFYLAAEPKYLGPLRQEVEDVIRENGWSKIAMTKMYKVDSFLKETLRMNALSAVAFKRKAMQDYTFSDGTFVPKGVLVSAAAHPIHLDDDIYPNAGVFDGFRFSDIRAKAGRKITNQFVNTNLDYMAFGHAKHACPGRFFAAIELKAMFAHLILNYDVKMENEGLRPANIWSGFVCQPDMRARVMFRRRQT